MPDISRKLFSCAYSSKNETDRKIVMNSVERNDVFFEESTCILIKRSLKIIGYSALIMSIVLPPGIFASFDLDGSTMMNREIIG